MLSIYKRLTTLTLAVALWGTQGAYGEAQAYVVGVPSTVGAAHQDVILKAVLKLILDAKAGDRIQVFDACQLNRVADITIPSSASARARVRQLGDEIAAVRTFLKPAAARPGSENAVRISAFLAMVAQLPLRNETSAIRILVFGSLFNRSDQDQTARFEPGWVPSDGCILATSRETVYGCADRKGQLEGTCVDWCWLNEPAGDLDRRAAERFWSIYFAELGATLSSCQASPDLMIEQALSGVSTPHTADRIDRRDTVIAIRKVTPPRVGRSSSPAAATTEQLGSAASEIPAPQAGFTKIAAVWTSADGQCDVDLWVQPAAGKPELSFAATDTPHGHYVRDIQHPRAGEADRNWIAAWEVVELRDAACESTTCWLNLYRNSGAEVNGIVRVLFANTYVDVPFRFAGTQGDQARGHRNRVGDPCWVRIDLPIGASTQSRQVQP